MLKKSLEERLNAIRKQVRADAPSLVPDFASERRTAQLDPETRQLLRRLDQWSEHGQTAETEDES